jgi:primosomal protein N' (replication factor Y)
VQKKGAHDTILDHFINHRADILIGTRMLAKGLDLPMVTLVGVVLAEVGLKLPDFRAGERVFQLLTQVAGRAGRSILGGKAIFQTYEPDHYVIQAASQHDFDGFYQQELKYRRGMNYPPFSRMARLEYRHRDPLDAESAATKMAQRVEHWLYIGEYTATHMIGPVPCFFSRVSGYYRWQIILHGPNPVRVLRDKDLGNWVVEIDPPSLL